LRFDQDINRLDSLHGEGPYQSILQKYPEFFPLFINKITGLGHYPENYKKFLSGFITYKDYRKLKKDVDSVYPNLNSFQSELEEGFRHFRYYYPHQSLPTFLTFYSGFNSAIVNTDSTLGIGLDMFLGSKYPIYRSVQFPAYITRTLESSYIPITAMKGYAKQLFSEKRGKVLDQMIYEGKILYFLDATFPKSHDSIKIGYTGKQLSWCKEHETEIWASLLEKDRLFHGDKNDFDTYFGEGPFTPGLDPNSAPRLGEWTGWQIVRKFMDQNPQIGLVQLMGMEDSEKILQLSGYRP